MIGHTAWLDLEGDLASHAASSPDLHAQTVPIESDQNLLQSGLQQGLPVTLIPVDTLLHIFDECGHLLLLCPFELHISR